MSARSTYVEMAGETTKEEWLRLGAWLPGAHQLWDAARFQLRDALDPFERGHITLTMRQGIGLIWVLGLVAGLLPFLANLLLGWRLGTSVPLAALADSVTQAAPDYRGFIPLDVVTHTAQLVAGLEPRMPGFLAALLSALGLWINVPLGWLATWLVYGTLVMAVARLMGAAGTLQSFFAATSLATLPLVLSGLSPIPVLGPLAGLVGVVWMLALYYQLVRYVTGLDAGRTLMAMLLAPTMLLAVPVMLAGLAVFWAAI